MAGKLTRRAAGEAGAVGRAAGAAGVRGGQGHSTRGRAALRPVLAALCLLAVAAAIVAALLAAQASTSEQGAESVRRAVLSAAAQCCAVEGSYPSTIEHLEEYYGLSVNHGDYVILYEAFASNVMPSVTVVPR